jgi:hypothetical protein
VSEEAGVLRAPQPLDMPVLYIGVVALALIVAVVAVMARRGPVAEAL